MAKKKKKEPQDELPEETVDLDLEKGKPEEDLVFLDDEEPDEEDAEFEAGLDEEEADFDEDADAEADEDEKEKSNYPDESQDAIKLYLKELRVWRLQNYEAEETHAHK